MVSLVSKVGSKAMLVITVLAIVGVPLFVEATRGLKSEAPKDNEVVHPENFYGGFGSGIIYPSPGGGTPVAAGGVGVTGHGSSMDFCSYPGLGCVRVEPTNPGAGSIEGVGGTPSPFP